MANDIEIIFPDTGEADFTADIYTPALSVRYSDVVLDDTGHLGIYGDDGSVPIPNLAPGDIVLVKKAGAIYDGFEYKPESLSKLAADGWDGLSIVEPSGDPDGWTVPQKLMWLVMRFLNQHSSDNFNGIMVKKADGSASTGQIVTEGGGVKTVSKAQ